MPTRVTARSRTIRYGFFTNEDLGECEPLARLLFEGLWLIADREGRLEDRPKRIKTTILPYDNVQIEKLLGQLEQRQFITRYCIDGEHYIQVDKFLDHQQPHYKEEKSRIPPPVRADPDVPVQAALALTEAIEHVVSKPKAKPVINVAALHEAEKAETALAVVEAPVAAVVAVEQAVKVVEPKAPAYSPEFETFWTTYPKRNGTTRGSKADAWKVFNKLSAADRDAAVDMAGLYSELESTKKENYRFVPDAEVWLRGRRWETVDEERRAEITQGLNGIGSNSNNGPSNNTGRPFRTAKYQQNEDSIGEEIQHRARRSASQHNLESTLGSQ